MILRPWYAPAPAGTAGTASNAATAVDNMHGTPTGAFISPVNPMGLQVPHGDPPGGDPRGGGRKGPPNKTGTGQGDCMSPIQLNPYLGTPSPPNSLGDSCPVY